MKGRVYEGLDDFILIITNNFHAFCINQKHYNFLQKVSNSRTFQTWICFDYINGPSRAKSRALKIQQGLNETATLSLSCVQTLKSYGVIAFFHHCATLVTRTTGYNRTWKKQPPMCAHTQYMCCSCPSSLNMWMMVNLRRIRFFNNGWNFSVGEWPLFEIAKSFQIGTDFYQSCFQKDFVTVD